ncbi:hypothetical protein GF339_13655 [candidate division KSB3 bacterium]|uniref:histidine kinase n=1 Tax=candidate division KSB3 bacterium TaxID=2044937 RepID=A0A9D5JWZ0_9BACT|nr:hypothetical protein [candidate division KSB3 bacterium]MBD3325625.1 hypothetical protein [candidate division KSB3 bacterium]
MPMALHSITRQYSSLWKQLVVIGLLIVISGSLLTYLYVQKRYTAFIDQEYRRYWQKIQHLRQQLYQMPDQDLHQGHPGHERIIPLLTAFLQDVPAVVRISVLDADGTLLVGKESQAAAQQMQALSPASLPTQVHKLHRPEATYVIQLPLLEDQQLWGVLRGEVVITRDDSVYAQITRITWYIIVLALSCLILFGAFLIGSQLTQHLAAKQEQLEDYALSLDRANEHLHRTQKELLVSEKLASLGYLAAGIAHEIGNPLGAALGYVELLKKTPRNPEKAADILQRIEQEIERIGRIIQELLHFSRPHSMTLQKHDVNAILHKVLSRLPIPQTKTIEIDFHATPFPLFAEVDEHKLHSVFLYVLSNSLDAIAAEGQIQISTSRRIRESSTMIGGSEVIAIQISDTGCGISEEHLSKIFDPFFTTKDPGQGMGLGLSLCHRIIESLHGEIEVHSVLGQGTDVLIFLPPFRKPDQEQADSG